MTTVSVSPAMLRKAEQLVAQASTWARGRSKVDGSGFFIVPASDGKSAHWSSPLGCTCRGHRERGICTHQLACQILQRQADAQIAAKHAVDFGPCRRCSEPATGKSKLCDRHFTELVDRIGL